MKKIFTIFIMSLALSISAEPARAGEFVTENRTSVRLYGGIGLNGPRAYRSTPLPGGEGVKAGDRTFPSVVYGFSVQRDLLPRLALELDVQNSYRNTFPDAANYVYADSYSGIPDLPAFQEYMDRLIADGGNPNNVDWVRHNSVAVTLRPVFHIVNTPEHRFSAYAGVGFHVTDGNRFKVDCLFPVPAPEDYTTDYRQYHFIGLAGAAGVRYEYTFAEHYMVGADFGLAFNDGRASWQNVSTMISECDCRALIYIGFRF